METDRDMVADDVMNYLEELGWDVTADEEITSVEREVTFEMADGRKVRVTFQ